MATEGKGEEQQQETTSPALGWRGTIEEQYRKVKTNAETYPYVWGSYIVVYGGFSLWLAYRWGKLRRTEDRVRVLQSRLRKLVEAEENSATASTATDKSSRPSDKPTK